MIAAQLIVNGLIIGSIYALVASGFSLIYSTNKIMHFAHGVSVIAASYFLFLFFSIIGVSLWISIIIAILMSAIFGLIIFKTTYEPLQNRKSSKVILLIASLGILILIENLLLLAFGGDTKIIKLASNPKTLEILGASITSLQITIILASLVIMVGLYILLYYTKIGRNFRAVSENKELLSILGINTKVLYAYAYVLGSVLAGIAGIFIALEQTITPTSGTTLLIKGFTGAIIGSISFVPGAIIGSYILGLVENISIWFLPTAYKDAIAFILLFIFLLFKPKGLFGFKKGERK